MKKMVVLASAVLAFTIPQGAFADSHANDDKKHEGMFAQKDTDGNGSISKDEFMAYSASKFAKMDADGNGEISKDEAMAHRKAMKDRMKDKRAEKMKEKAHDKKGHDDHHAHD